MIGNATINFLTKEELIQHFDDCNVNIKKLEAVKAFKELTGLGLKESKDWIDFHWNNHLGQNVLEYYLNTLKYKNVHNKYEIHIAQAEEYLNLTISIDKSITSSDIDELLEVLTKKIAKFKH